MTEATKAETMLDQVTKVNSLIRRLEECKNQPFDSLGYLSAQTKANIQMFRDNVQSYIDELTAQRERVVGLVEQIADGEVQLVLQLRYGLLGNATKKMKWYDIPPIMNYEMDTIYKRHRKGLDYLNELLEKDGENRC